MKPFGSSPNYPYVAVLHQYPIYVYHSPFYFTNVLTYTHKKKTHLLKALNKNQSIFITVKKRETYCCIVHLKSS